jgi:hypothetical protein
MTRIGSAGFTVVTSPVVSSSSTTRPFCGVLWLKSNIISERARDAVEGAAADDAHPRKVSSINRTEDNFEA